MHAHPPFADIRQPPHPAANARITLALRPLVVSWIVSRPKGRLRMMSRSSDFQLDCRHCTRRSTIGIRIGLCMIRPKRTRTQKPRSTDVGPSSAPIVPVADAPVLEDPTHLFNQPGLQALDFLIAVMRDTRVQLNIRISVAGWLAENFPDPSYYMPPRVCIVIPPFPREYLQ